MNKTPKPVSTQPAAKCPWCECFEPEHTVRCWEVQKRRGTDPWGKRKDR